MAAPGGITPAVGNHSGDFCRDIRGCPRRVDIPRGTRQAQPHREVVASSLAGEGRVTVNYVNGLLPWVAFLSGS